MRRKAVQGFSLIELVIAVLIVAILARIAMPIYTSARLRSERGNGESCLTDLAQKQETYYTRNNAYASDLTALGYDASSSATCNSTTKYKVTASVVDASTCPLTRCYRLSAVPQSSQVRDGTLYLSYDSSKSDPNSRLVKELGTVGSGQPWN